jgi:hypothetical protein
MRIVKVILIAVAVLLIIIQFVPAGIPENHPVDERSLEKSTIADEEVVSLLMNSCYDCHSSQTNHPWYSKVAPFSWLLARHITEGREHLNFSEWEDYNTRKKIGLLEDIKDEVEAGNMPLDSYLIIHRDAKLDQDAIQAIVEWVEESTEMLFK